MKTVSIAPTPPGVSDFVAFAAALLAAKGDVNALAGIGASRRVPERVDRMIRKATVSDLSTEGLDIDARIVGAAFIESLRNATAFDRLLQNGMRIIPSRTRIAATTAAPEAQRRAEGNRAPVTRLSLSANRLLPNTSSAIVVATAEFIDAGPAFEAHVGRELVRGVAASTDATFIAGLIARAGTGQTLVSAGDDWRAVAVDLRNALAGLVATAESKPFVIVSPARARFLTFMQGDNGDGFAFPDMGAFGGTIQKLPVIVTDQITDADVLVVDAVQIAGNTMPATLKSSNETTLQARDFLETGDADADALSMFQTDSGAIMCQRIFAYDTITPTAVVHLESVGWGEATE